MTRFVSTFGTKDLKINRILKNLLGYAPHWGFKPTFAVHADSPGVYTSEKVLNLNTMYVIHLKCDIFDGSVVNGIRQQLMFSFILNKPAGYKVFYEPETIHYKKENKSVLYNITFF